MMIRRLGPGDEKELNLLANDPSIRPWIGGFAKGDLDWSSLLHNPNVYALYGHYGGIISTPVMPGLYECHMQVLPAGRGKWAVEMASEVFRRLFCDTDAMELVARIPEYNKAARGMMRLIGAHREHDQDGGWIKDGRIYKVSWYSLTIFDWIRQDPYYHQIHLCAGGHKGKKHVFGKRMALMRAHVGEIDA